MSELKGQLLGVILVLALFSMVAGAMRIITDRYTQTIDQNTTATIGEITNSEENP